jgi:hypothetical protein
VHTGRASGRPVLLAAPVELTERVARAMSPRGVSPTGATDSRRLDRATDFSLAKTPKQEKQFSACKSCFPALFRPRIDFRPPPLTVGACRLDYFFPGISIALTLSGPRCCLRHGSRFPSVDVFLFILFSCVARLTGVRVFAWLNLLCFQGFVANQRFSEYKARTVCVIGCMVILVFKTTHVDMGHALGIPKI